jgi:alpha-glucosidase (family GH31 glycosyl hydrolase)
MIHPLDDIGVDFFWIDYENKKDVSTLFIINHYHIYDMTRNYKRRPMILSYNTSIAPHRYPVLDSGRTIVGWDTLKMVALHNVNIANIGVSWWSHDIGGFYKGNEDDELYTRFVQLGTFSPILRLNSDEGKYYKREPWRWGITTYTIVKDYLQLRHKLIPYLYSEAYRYYKDGIPLLKPIYYNFPDLYDDVLYNNEYFFGSQMFVSPIISRKDPIMNRSIQRFFLPDGTWYDFVTGKRFPGGKKYISFFRDEDYPIFAKAGAIIPMGTNPTLNNTNPPTDMEIHIFPGRSNIYYLYEDDGVSDLYKKGYHLLTSIDYNYLVNNYTVIIRAIEGKSGIVPDHRNYKFRFRNTKQANSVIAYYNSNNIETNSYVEGNDFIVEVKDISTTGQLTINCKGKDIEIDAIRVINDDIEAIISDLQIDTELKNKIDAVLFSDQTIKRKRIGIRRLKGQGLEGKFVKLFLKLLEYIDQV